MTKPASPFEPIYVLPANLENSEASPSYRSRERSDSERTPAHSAPALACSNRASKSRKSREWARRRKGPRSRRGPRGSLRQPQRRGRKQPIRQRNQRRADNFIPAFSRHAYNGLVPPSDASGHANPARRSRCRGWKRSQASCPRGCDK